MAAGNFRRNLSEAWWSVIGWARENMANYKVPRHVEITDELPLNASGKVLKFELRDRAIAALERST